MYSGEKSAGKNLSFVIEITNCQKITRSEFDDVKVVYDIECFDN